MVMLTLYDSKDNVVHLLESNDFILKKKSFSEVSFEANKAKLICEVKDIADKSKMITTFQVSDIISTPYNDDVFLVVYKKYNTSIMAYTNQTQKLSFEISWIEKT